MFKKEMVIETIKNYLEIEEFLYGFAKEFGSLRGEPFRFVSELEIFENVIHVWTENNIKLTIPIEYLWLENWKEIEKEKIKQREEALALQEEKKRSLRNKKEEEKDRREYQRLKAKFEGTTCPVCGASDIEDCDAGLHG